MRNLIRGLIPALVLALLPVAADAGVFIGVSVGIAPPELPVYVQPEIPAPGYIWTPGYWAWGPEGYFWVPGTWVLPPAVGLLWTPGYWGWGDGAYLWHDGYWGPHVGFYGGVNYGCGYFGSGYEGGYWRGRDFFYNGAVNNVRSIDDTHIYSRPVRGGAMNHVSFNGGAGGIVARPSPRDLSAERERHVEFTSLQRQHENLARGDERLRASVNGGHPPVAATARPGNFTGRGVVAARGAGGGYPGSAAAGTHPQYPTARQGNYPRSATPHGGYGQVAGVPHQGYPRSVNAAPDGYPRAAGAQGGYPRNAGVPQAGGYPHYSAPQGGYGRAPGGYPHAAPSQAAPHAGAPQAAPGYPGGHEARGEGVGPGRR